MNWMKVLAGWVLTRVLGRDREERERRKARRRLGPRGRLVAADPRAIAEHEQDAERTHAARRAELIAAIDDADDERDDERARRDAAEALEKDHEEIRRRRAEPPPTVERELESTPLAEWTVILGLLAMAAGAAGFIVFYIVIPDTQLLGLSMGLAFLAGGVAAAVAGKKVVPQEKAAEPYHYFGDPEAQEDVAAVVSEGKEGISRRKLIVGAAGVAGGTVGAATLFPAASLGPSVGQTIYTTPWHEGKRVVDSTGSFIAATDVPENGFLIAFPHLAPRNRIGSPIILVRYDPADLTLEGDRINFAPLGIIAYSRICTHAGCAVSIYREPLYPPNEPQHALVCPCHFSTFDSKDGGRVLFGPAPRPLPQLPLRLGEDDILEAAGDFFDPVGPSYGGIRLEERPT